MIRRVTFKRHKLIKSNLHRIVSTGPIKPWRLYLLLASVQKAEGEGGDLGVCSGFYTIEPKYTDLHRIKALCALKTKFMAGTQTRASESVLES